MTKASSRGRAARRDRTPVPADSTPRRQEVARDVSETPSERPHRPRPRCSPPRSLLGFSACGSSKSVTGTNIAASHAAGASTTTLPAGAPARIVSLSPTATEMLFAIGAGPQVKAVDDQSNYPPQAPHTKLSGYQPNAEAVAGYSPDLVVMSDASIAPRTAARCTSRFSCSRRRTRSTTPTRKSTTSARDGARRAGGAGRREDARRHRRDHGRGPAGAPSSPTTTSSTTPTSPRRRTPSSASCTRSPACTTSPTRPTRRIPAATRSSRRSTSCSRTPTSCSSPTPSAAARPRRPRRNARAGTRCKAVTGGNVVLLDDDIASRWGPRVVDLLRTIVEQSEPGAEPMIRQ